MKVIALPVRYFLISVALGQLLVDALVCLSTQISAASYSAHLLLLDQALRFSLGNEVATGSSDRLGASQVEFATASLLFLTLLNGLLGRIIV